MFCLAVRYFTLYKKYNYEKNTVASPSIEHPIFKIFIETGLKEQLYRIYIKIIFIFINYIFIMYE